MRYLVGFMCVVATFAVSPLDACAQGSEKQSGSSLERWHPEAFESPSQPASEEPALQIDLDSSGLEVWTGRPPLEQGDRDVRRARGWLVGSSILLVAGAGMALGGGVVCANTGSGDSLNDEVGKCLLAIGGGVLGTVGLVGVIISGVKLGTRKRALRTLEEAKYAKPRRARWELVRSRLVF